MTNLTKPTDVLDGYEGPVLDEQATSFPIIGWRNGQGRNEPGYFYVRADVLADDPDPAIWKASDRYSTNLKVEHGFEAEQLDIIVLAERAQWYRKNLDAPPIWLDDYEEGASKRVSWLAKLSGIDELVVVEFSGMPGRDAERLLQDYKKRIKGAAEKRRKVGYNTWLCAIPVASTRDAHGRVVSVKTERGGTYTPPAAQWPKDMEPLEIAITYAVGSDAYASYTELRQLHDDWRNQRYRSKSTSPTRARPNGDMSRHPAFVPISEENLPDLP